MFEFLESKLKEAKEAEQAAFDALDKAQIRLVPKKKALESAEAEVAQLESLIEEAKEHAAKEAKKKAGAKKRAGKKAVKKDDKEEASEAPEASNEENKNEFDE